MALTPQQLAELQRLKQMYAPLVEAQRRKDQADANAQKMNIPLEPNKATGGSIPSQDVMRLAIGGRSLVGSGKPFHSGLDKAAGLIKRKVGTGAEFMQELKSLGGVKQAEIEDRKLAEIMGMPRMTHDQFMANLAMRPVPAIGEKVLGGDPDDPNWIGPYHYTYTLPGGENYREMLIKAPEPQGHSEKLMELEAKLRRAPPDKVAHYQSLISKYQKLASQNEQFEGNSNHFGGEPGILASMRLKDRTGPNGEKLLHLEELQSDWHQQGREKGYISQDIEKQLEVGKERMAKRGEQIRQLTNQITPETPLEEFSRLSDEIQRLRELQAQDTDWGNNLIDTKQYGVPDAPFKKNWEEMALKRLIHHAAEKGYHGIVVTPGTEQADRYSLAKHVDEISHNPRTNMATGEKSKSVRIDMKSGSPVQLGVANSGVIDNVSNPDHTNLIGKHLADVVGKDLAKNIMNEERGILSPQDLTLGGEGMKAFYDKKVPNILNSIGKKHGVKTQLHEHPLHDIPALPRDHEPEDVESHAKMAGTKLHYFPITEDMRKDILTNGLPMYDHGGEVDAEAVFMGKGGKVKELEQYLRDREGEYGVKRLQRAADEIPGLENMYTLQALKEAFGGDNAKALMTMDPADFERFAAPLIQRSKTAFAPNQTSIDKHSLPTDEYIQHLARIKGFSDVPFLSANKEEQGLPLLPYITGHEGRHRSRALAKMGKTKNLVRLIPSSELREPFPRRSREEYIQALKNELAMTKNLIMPEAYRTSQSDSKIKRPAIELPEIYKNGGEVDAEDYFFPKSKE